MTDNWRHSVMEDDKKRLSEYGLKDGDIVVIERRSGERETAAGAKVDVGRGFSLLHHEKQCVCTLAGECPICACAGPSPLAPNLSNLTVRPLTTASGIAPERPNIKFKLLMVRRFSAVKYLVFPNGAL